MKITHKLNPGWSPPVAEIDDAYQREIDKTLHRAAQRAHKAAVAELALAERAARRDASEKARQWLAAARTAVAQRLAELEAIERLMQRPPAVAAHRAHAVLPNASKL